MYQHPVTLLRKNNYGIILHIEVPDISFIAVGLPGKALVILVPGAKISTPMGHQHTMEIKER